LKKNEELIKMTSIDNEKLIISSLKELENKIHDAIRPAREVDARATWVWATAFSLFYISIASEKPTQISNEFTGTVHVNNWAHIATAIIFILLYWIRDLYIVSTLTKARVQCLLDQFFTELHGLYSATIKTNKRLKELFEKLSEEEKQLSSWYCAELDNINFEWKNLDLDEYHSGLENFEDEYNRKIKEVDIHQAEIDLIMEYTNSERTIKAITDSEKFLSHATSRQNNVYNLSVRLPIAFACVSILIFLIELFYPSFY
jgi:hypothetical protein